MQFNGSQLAKIKKVDSLHVPAIKYMGRRSGWFKKFQLYFKNYDFCEYVKFGAILLKFDIFIIL